MEEYNNNKRKYKEEIVEPPIKRPRLDDVSPITFEEQEKLFSATQVLNELTCNAFNFVDANEICNGSRANKIAPVVCEHGTTRSELNDPINQFKENISVDDDGDDDGSDYYFRISHQKPLFMSEEVLKTFKSHFSDDLIVEGGDISYFSIDTMLKAMLPGQVRLIENIKHIMRTYSIDEDDIPLYKLAEPCENIACFAPYSINYISNYVSDDDIGYPKIPKLHNPSVYNLSRDLYSDAKKAKIYLDGLNNALRHEVTTQCVVCDAVQYFFSKYNSNHENLYTLKSMPNVNHQFYRNSSNHTITMDADFFKKVKIERLSDGNFQIVYNDKVYQ